MVYAWVPSLLLILGDRLNGDDLDALVPQDIQYLFISGFIGYQLVDTIDGRDIGEVLPPRLSSG